MKRLIGAVCVLLGACVGTETGNPGFDGTLSYAAYSSDPSVAALSEGDALVVDKAWMALGDVHFLRAPDCEPSSIDEPPDSPALGVTDPADVSADRTADLSLPIADYCGVQVALTRADASATLGPASLHSHSMSITGALRDTTPYRIDSALQIALQLRAPRGTFTADEDHANFVVGFDVARWFAGLDWSRAVRVDGVVVLDETHNVELLRDYERNVRGSVALFRADRPGGAIDPRATPLAATSLP